MAGCATAATIFALLLVPRQAASQDLRSRVVLEIDRVEHEIHDRRWNLNDLEEKRGLERELALLSKLYDGIIRHESDLMTFECSGATLDPNGGPPVSTEDSDELGTLALGSQQAITPPPAGGVGGGGEPATPQYPGAGNVGGLGYRFVFVRQVTDTEVQLLAQIVYIDDRLRNDDWHLNNLGEKRNLQVERAKAMSALRRVRNGRC